MAKVSKTPDEPKNPDCKSTLLSLQAYLPLEWYMAPFFLCILSFGFLMPLWPVARLLPHVAAGIRRAYIAFRMVVPETSIILFKGLGTVGYG